MSNARNGSNFGDDGGLEKLKAASPFLIDIRPACEVIPALDAHDFLHAGPPLEGWHEACGALRGAVIGTILHIGMARNVADAEAVATKSIRLVPAHDHNALGTFGGIIARRTPVVVVRDQSSDTLAFAALNEGRGKALRYGSYDSDTLVRLSWMETELAHMLGQAIRLAGGIDLFEIMSQALHMGDDCHSRQRAGSALFLSKIAPYFCEGGFPAKDLTRVFQFLSQNDFFFLPLAMAAAKSALASVEGIPGSTLVTAMAFNGVRCGIRVSGHGPRWWTAPVQPPQGQYFQGYSPDDAGPIIGDSEITETIGTRRICNGGSAGPCALCGRHHRTGNALYARDVQDYVRGASALHYSSARIPRHAFRHRRTARRGNRYRAGIQYRNRAPHGRHWANRRRVQPDADCVLSPGNRSTLNG